MLTSRKWIGIAAVPAISASIGGIGLVQASGGGGNAMTAIAPCRLLDTRATGPIGPRSTPLGANETETVTAKGNNGQCTGIAADAQAVEVQITSTEATSVGYVTAFPADLTSPPNVSHLNTRPGEVISNSTIVSLSPTGQFKLYNFSGTTNLIVDVLAVFSPSGATGVEGPAGPQGPVGPAGATGLVGVYTQKAIADIKVIAPGATVTALSECTPGKVAIGGGYKLGNTDPNIEIVTNQPGGAYVGGMFTGWEVKVKNGSLVQINVQVAVVCAKVN